MDQKIESSVHPSLAVEISDLGLPCEVARGESLHKFLLGYGPKEFWDVRLAMAGVPRPSYGEAKVRDLLKKLAEGNGLETLVDKAGNLIIKAPGRGKGLHAEPVILQAHLDMVCEKEKWAPCDPAKDRIELLVRRQQVTGRQEPAFVLAADGTTSGDDNADGVSFALCAALSPEINDAPPLEILLTVAEEMDMDGAEGLDASLLKGKMLLNLDHEAFGEILISSGGNCDVSGKWAVKREPVAENTVPVCLKLENLPGGHSAMEIDKGKGNALQCLSRAILEMAGTFDGLRLASIDGGNATNAIPTSAQGVVWINNKDLETFVGVFHKTAKKVLQQSGLAGEFRDSVKYFAGQPDKLLPPMTDGYKVLEGICAVESMAFSYSGKVPGLIAASNNLGIVKTEGDAVNIYCLARGESKSQTELARKRVMESIRKTAGEASSGVLHAAWEPSAAGTLFEVVESAYSRILGRIPAVNGCHGALETGIIKEKAPQVDMVSIGPDIFDVHTTRECLPLDTVGPFWKVLKLTLEGLCARTVS